MAQAETDNSTPAPDGLRSPQDSLYFPTPVTPEEAFQAIGRLRKDARDEIDRLIRFLDHTDNHMELEPEEEGDEADAEPSLGSFDQMPNQDKAWRQFCDWATPALDAEQDEADDEPSLGFLERHCSHYSPGRDFTGNQEAICDGLGRDLEDEHDGAEPENEGGCGAKEDDEPSLGWPERVDQTKGAGSQTGDDRELQDHATVLPVAPRAAQGVMVEDRGYGGRKVIRNLTDGQQEAMAEKMDRYGKVSLQ